MRIRENTDDEYSAGLREWIEIVPEEGKQSEPNGQCTDEQTAVRQTVGLNVAHLLRQYLCGLFKTVYIIRKINIMSVVSLRLILTRVVKA